MHMCKWHCSNMHVCNLHI